MKGTLLALATLAALAGAVSAQTDQPYQTDVNNQDATTTTTDPAATTTSSDDLPATASSTPLLFVGGLAALTVGLSLRPRRRA